MSTWLERWHAEQMLDPEYRLAYEKQEPSFQAARKRLSRGWEPLKSFRDHDMAMQEIDKLWGSPAGTTEGQRLDKLVTLVVEFEALVYPIGRPDWWDRFLYWLDKRWGINFWWGR